MDIYLNVSFHKLYVEFLDEIRVILEVDSSESGFERDFRRESQKWDFIGILKVKGCKIAVWFWDFAIPQDRKR